MNRWIKFSAAAAMLGCAPATAQPTPDETFCYDLRRIVDAADEDVPFYSLERSAAAPPRLGFSSSCRANGSGRLRAWVCGQSLAPEWLTIQSLSARTAACLPQARQVHFATWRETEFRLPGVIIRISESGAPGAHVGRIVGYSVDAVAPTEGKSEAKAGKSNG